jgi:hypothetical protein
MMLIHGYEKSKALTKDRLVAEFRGGTLPSVLAMRTHLVRNAFGGGDHETLLGLTGVQAPLSRNVRDDITVQVIFFENELEQTKD